MAVHQPPVEIVNEGGPALWEYAAFGTRYRGLLVETGPEGPSLFGMGGDVLVAVSPAGGKRNLPTGRMWHVFPIDRLSASRIVSATASSPSQANFCSTYDWCRAARAVRSRPAQIGSEASASRAGAHRCPATVTSSTS